MAKDSSQRSSTSKDGVSQRATSNTTPEASDKKEKSERKRNTQQEGHLDANVVLKEKKGASAKPKAGAKKDPNDIDNSSVRGKVRIGREGKPDKKKKKKKVEAKKEPTFRAKKRKAGFFAKLFDSGPDVILYDPRAIEAAEALQLEQKHLRKLRTKFDEIDIDGSGSIDIDEFLESLGEQRSPFTEKVFRSIDLNGSGSIEFEEYVRILATYCMFTKDEILRFCFECFDKDGSNAIDENEFMQLCMVINNASPMFPGNFKKALEQFDVNDDGLIDYSEFCELERRYPIILFPAFRLQDSLQKGSLGESTWLKIIEDYNKSKRIEEYKTLHGGRLPPDPILTQIGKTCCPCLYKTRIHVKLGADMEARHRNQYDVSK